LQSPELQPALATNYRSLVMRGQYLAQDRPDLSEGIKCLTRRMRNPRQCDWNDLKKLGRYVTTRGRVVQVFRHQRMPEQLDVFGDSDHAGCLVTRRSTTGLVVQFGQCVVKHSSNIQTTIALSSGESEYYALVKAAALGLAVQSMLEDWGIKIPLRVSSDSSAAKGTSGRLGLGKLRHIQTRYLWLQERVHVGDLQIRKIPGSTNQSDLLTKALTAPDINRYMEKMGYEYRKGRAENAPQTLTHF